MLCAVIFNTGGKCSLCGIPKSRSKEGNFYLFFFLFWCVCVFFLSLLNCSWKSKHAVGILGKGSLKMNSVTINQVLHKNSAVHRFAESA